MIVRRTFVIVMVLQISLRNWKRNVFNDMDMLSEMMVTRCIREACTWKSMGNGPKAERNGDILIR